MQLKILQRENMNELNNLESIFENVKKFTISLKSQNDFSFKPVSNGELKNGNNLKLGFSSYGLKLYFMLGIWDELDTKSQNSWTEYINTFQSKGGTQVSNFYLDPGIKNYYDSLDFKKEVKYFAKYFLKTFTNKKYDSKKQEYFKAINADTKQAISTLYEVGAKNATHIPNLYNSNEEMLNYLSSLNWEKPWSAGAQFSSLCVYSITQEYGNENQLLDFLNKLVDKSTGSYFSKLPNEPREIINGAMKIITGLDWLNKEIHYPNELINFCLSNVPVTEGCDIVDYIYVLYKCSKETDHRRNEIQDKMLNAISSIRKLYKDVEGGFSYFENKSQTHYYGVPFSQGLNTADIHGTLLCTWGLLMALKTLNVDIAKYNIIRP